MKQKWNTYGIKTKINLNTVTFKCYDIFYYLFQETIIF